MTQQPTQRPDRAAILAATAAALAADLVVLQRRQQEAVATARAVCHHTQRHRARRLVDLGAEFGGEEVPRRYRASLQAPAAAVLLT